MYWDFAKSATERALQYPVEKTDIGKNNRKNTEERKCSPSSNSHCVVLLGSNFAEVNKGSMKESYCVYIGRVHIYYLIKPCFVLLCFDSEQIRPATFFGYNWDRDLILRPGWQEKSSAPFELCRTRLQINDDTRKNLKRGRSLSLFIHQCLSVRAVSWQWSTPGDQHTKDAAAGLLGVVKKITLSVNPHEARQIEKTFREVRNCWRGCRGRWMSRVY